MDPQLPNQDPETPAQHTENSTTAEQQWSKQSGTDCEHPALQHWHKHQYTEPQRWWRWDTMRRHFTTCSMSMYMRSFRPHWYKIKSLPSIWIPCQGSASHHAPHPTAPMLSPEWWDQVLQKRTTISKQANQRLTQPGWGIHQVNRSEESWVDLETWNLSPAMSDPQESALNKKFIQICVRMNSIFFGVGLGLTSWDFWIGTSIYIYISMLGVLEWHVWKHG